MEELDELFESCYNTTAKASCITNLKEATNEAESKNLTEKDLEKYRNLTTKLEKEKVNVVQE